MIKLLSRNFAELSSPTQVSWQLDFWGSTCNFWMVISCIFQLSSDVFCIRHLAFQGVNRQQSRHCICIFPFSLTLYSRALLALASRALLALVSSLARVRSAVGLLCAAPHVGHAKIVARDAHMIVPHSWLLSYAYASWVLSKQVRQHVYHMDHARDYAYRYQNFAFTGFVHIATGSLNWTDELIKIFVEHYMFRLTQSFTQLDR